MTEAPFKIGDKVRTHFYPKRKDMMAVWTVKNVYVPSHSCGSGWMVDAEREDGKVLVCDSGWFRKAEEELF